MSHHRRGLVLCREQTVVLPNPEQESRELTLPSHLAYLAMTVCPPARDKRCTREAQECEEETDRQAVHDDAVNEKYDRYSDPRGSQLKDMGFLLVFQSNWVCCQVCCLSQRQEDNEAD